MFLDKKKIAGFQIGSPSYVPDLSGQKVGRTQNAKHLNKRGGIYSFYLISYSIHSHASRVLFAHYIDVT
jgi:hypothetical protein